MRIPPDALPADDAFRFVLSPGQALPVLVLAGAGRSLYLRRALEYSDPPGFAVTVREAAELRAADLARAAVVVLDDAPVPGGEAGRALRAWVAGGGGLVVAAGAASQPDGIPGIGAGALAAAADAGGPDGIALGQLDYGHPVLQPFAVPGSGSFADARFYRRRPITPGDSTAVLARFEDGTAALVERRSGRGRVLLWGSTFDTRWSDFPLKPVFLPFVQRLVRYAAAWSPPPTSATVGQVVDPTVGAQSAPRRPRLAVAPSGARTTLAAPALALTEAGFYELRDDAGHPAGVLAANPDLAESDLSTLDPQELAAAVSGPGAPVAGAAPASPPADLTAAQLEARQRIWWYLLASACVLFAAETLFSNRLSRSGRVEA